MLVCQKLKINSSIIKLKILAFGDLIFRQRFIDLCEGKIDKGAITMMKDVSLMQKGASGEHLYNKAQDIAFDDVLSQYIMHSRVQYDGCLFII